MDLIPKRRAASGSSWFSSSGRRLWQTNSASPSTSAAPGVSSAVPVSKGTTVFRGPSGESCKAREKLVVPSTPFSSWRRICTCDSRSKVARNDSLTRCSILSSWLCRPAARCKDQFSIATLSWSPIASSKRSSLGRKILGLRLPTSSTPYEFSRTRNPTTSNVLSPSRTQSARSSWKSASRCQATPREGRDRSGKTTKFPHLSPHEAR